MSSWNLSSGAEWVTEKNLRVVSNGGEGRVCWIEEGEGWCPIRPIIRMYDHSPRWWKRTEHRGRPRDIDVDLGMEEGTLLLKHPWKMLLAYGRL